MNSARIVAKVRPTSIPWVSFQEERRGIFVESEVVTKPMHTTLSRSWAELRSVDFPLALAAMKAGCKVRRPSHENDGHYEMRDGVVHFVPIELRPREVLVFSAGDVLAEDWQVLP